MLYKASTAEEFVEVYEVQADKGLVLTDKIRTGYLMDNINLAQDGSLIVAGFPKPLKMAAIFHNEGTGKVAPSVTIRISKNTGKDAFYGQKWNVDKVFEDDGHVMSGATNGLLDTDRNVLFLGGIMAPHTAVCKIPTL